MGKISLTMGHMSSMKKDIFYDYMCFFFLFRSILQSDGNEIPSSYLTVCHGIDGP